MTKDILISIKGLQFEDPASKHHENVELIVPGTYYEKNGTKYLIYEEDVEGMPEKIRTMMKLRPERVELSKTGAMAVSMVFEKGQKNLSRYNTPFGGLMVGLDTTDINIAENEDDISVNIIYHLDLNYEYFADCRVSIKACSKEMGQTMFT